MKFIYTLLSASFLSFAFANENTLSNIIQLTFPSMGFEKAGEAYFSPDDQYVSFQAVPTGENDYQIYTLHLATQKITKISSNSGACTCSFFHPDGERMIFAASSKKAEAANPGKYKWDLTRYMNIYESRLDGTQL